jgi:hypothetical protein
MSTQKRPAANLGKPDQRVLKLTRNQGFFNRRQRVPDNYRAF